MSTRLLLSVVLLAGLATLVACSDESTTPADVDATAFIPNAERGFEAFVAECASCHASGDGFDLAFFNFPDSMIVRRALGHVDEATSNDIVAYIRSLRVGGVPRHARIRQPGDRVLDSDVDFALELFGHDAWPADLTTADLLAIDPLTVPIAVPLPEWSVEGSNVDWMPDVPLGPGILLYKGSLPVQAMDEYRRNPTDENLTQAVLVLRVAAQDRVNASAPCVLQDDARVRYHECFEVQRWISSFGAQHMVRMGREDGLHEFVHDAFWAVGNVARHAMVHGGVVFENGDENWASWMYLGWMFEPQNHASFYTARGLANFDLWRHSTFVALRSLVARGEGTSTPYDDVLMAVSFAPSHWSTAAVTFGFRHVLERMESGDYPVRLRMDETIDDVRITVVRTYAVAVQKSPGDYLELAELRDQVLAALPN